MNCIHDVCAAIPNFFPGQRRHCCFCVVSVWASCKSPVFYKHFEGSLINVTTVRPQCPRSSSEQPFTPERRVRERSLRSCTAAVTSGTNPPSAATPVRARLRSPRTSTNGPTRRHPSSLSRPVRQESHV